MIKRFHYLTFLLFIIWSSLICFFYLKNFHGLSFKDNFVIDKIIWGALLIVLCILSGNRVLRLFAFKDISTLDEILFSAGIGAGILSISIFVLGLIQGFSPWALGLLLIGFGVFSFSNYGYGKLLWDRATTWHPGFTLLELIILLLIAGFALLTLCNTLTPPFYRDALIHHLAIPKWYIRHHGIVDVPFAFFSYYPPLMEMLYAGALLFSSDIFAQLIHFLFYMGTLCFTFALAKKILSRPMRLLAVLLFGSLPVVCQVSSIAYSDLGLTFYTVAGVSALSHWRSTRNQRWFYLGALMAGLAVGCKYNALIVFFSVLTGVLFTFAQWKAPVQQIAKNITLFLFLVFLVNAFWLGKNFCYTGNPVFPLARNIIGKKILAEQPQFSPFEKRNLLYGETLRDQLLLPWNLSVLTNTKARHELDGVINPIFLVFLPFFIFLPKKPPEIKWIAYVSLLYFLFFWASSVIRLRYLMPIYPLLGILTAYTIVHLEIKWKKFFIGLTLSFVFLLNLFWVVRYTASVNPINFLTGKESRQEFLCRHLPAYPAYEYANAHCPPTARIMFLFGGNFGNDGYYLDRDYFFDSQCFGSTVKNILQKSSTPEEVRKELSCMGITHLFINWNLLRIDFSSSLPEEKLLLYKTFCQQYLHLEFTQGGSFLYRLR